MFFNRFPNPKSKPCKRGGLGKALKLLGDFVPTLYDLADSSTVLTSFDEWNWIGLLDNFRNMYVNYTYAYAHTYVTFSSKLKPLSLNLYTCI